MAVRFVNPISTPYESQFVPLPIEYMAKNLEAKQKAFDEGTQTISQQVFDLPDVPWTTNANVLAQPFIQERDKILTNLQQTGNVNQALLQMNNLKKNWTNNERVKQQLEYINYYEQLKPIYQKDPNLLQTGWDPNFMQEPGQWTKRDWAKQAEEFDVLRGQAPALYGDQTVKYITENIGEKLRGIEIGNSKVSNAVWDPNVGKFRAITQDGKTHLISSEDPWTKNAIKSWAQRINDETLGTDINERYIREAKFGKLASDKQTRGLAIEQLITSILSPYYMSSTLNKETDEWITPSDDGDGTTKSSDYQFYPHESLPDLNTQKFDDFYNAMSNIQSAARNYQDVSINTGLEHFGSDVDFLKKLVTYFPQSGIKPEDIKPGYTLKKDSQIWKDILFEMNNNDELIEITGADGNKNFFTRKEIVLNELSNKAVEESAKLQNSTNPKDIARSQELNSIVANISEAYTLREKHSEIYGLVQKEEQKVLDNFVNNYDYKGSLFDQAISQVNPAYKMLIGLKGTREKVLQTISNYGGKDFVKDVTQGSYEEAMNNAMYEFYQKTGIAIKNFVNDDFDLIYNKNLYKQETKGRQLLTSDEERKIRQDYELLKKSVDDIRQSYKYEREKHSLTSTISKGVYYTVDGKETAAPVQQMTQYLQDFKTTTLPQMMERMFGSEYDVDAEGLQDLLESPMIRSSVDPGFDFTKVSLADGKAIGFDIDATDGVHVIYSVGQKEGDQTKNAKFRFKLDPVSLTSFKQNVIIPMITDPSQTTSEHGISLLVQMEMDANEKNLIRLVTSGFDLPGEYKHKKLDVNSALGNFEFDLISTSTGVVLVNSKDPKQKIPVSKNYQSTMQAIAAMIRDNLPKGSGGPQTPGKPSKPADKTWLR